MFYQTTKTVMLELLREDQKKLTCLFYLV